MIGKYDFAKKKFEMDDKKIRALRNIHVKANCDDCDHHLCWGGCPLRNLQVNRKLTEPDKNYCRDRTQEIHIYLKYLAERDVIRIKPCLLERRGKLYYSAQFTDFELDKKGFEKNPLIRFDAEKQDLEKLFDDIVQLNEKNKRKLRLFLLSPAGNERLDARRSIELKEFLFALRQNRIFFRITKPLKIEDYNKESENEFYKTFSIPRNCFECLEMFKIKNGRIEFCNGVGGPKVEDVFDREEIYKRFKNTMSREQHKECAGWK